jgi:two-component system CheB/CheR fusion protein
MNDDSQSASEPVRRARELTNTQQRLRREAENLREASHEVKERFAALRPKSAEEQRLRLATLNLIEDAEEARRRTEAAADERNRAERALSESEERLRLIVENARDYAIFSMDLQRRVTAWNSGAQQILGYSAEEILGRSADIIFVEEDRARGACERETETALRAGRAADERWHLRKDGTRFWGSGVMMPMQGPAGDKIGFVKIFRDNTAAKAREEELAASRAQLEEALQQTQRAREEAESANRTKDTFLAILSHELRTPLMPVLMTAESLLKRPDLPERVRKGLEMISRNVELETHFINDLLDLTRISRGKFELLREPVDLHAVLRTVIEICEPEIKEREQLMTVKFDAAADRVLGDFPRLQQVFWNLLKNASKFTPRGGEIKIETKNDDHSFLIRISDTGIGIEQGDLNGIFEPFRQADTEITRQYGGLGLGLAIAKATVEQLGGSISAESEGRGRGAVFTVRLPLLSEE